MPAKTPIAVYNHSKKFRILTYDSDVGPWKDAKLKAVNLDKLECVGFLTVELN